jgi:hypothetical protein
MLVDLDKGQMELLINLLETSDGIFNAVYVVNTESEEYKLAEHLKQVLEREKPFEDFNTTRAVTITKIRGISITSTPPGFRALAPDDAGRIIYTDNNPLVWNGTSWQKV